MMRTNGASDARKRGIENRVPESAKYKHVQSALNTGPTASRVKHLTNSQVLRRRDEIFLRISPTDLTELFEEYEKVDDEALVDNVRGGCETGPRVVVYEEEAKVDYDRPYLLLDVRTAEEFAACHLLQARSMPQRLLMQDKIHADIYKFKNIDGKLIVLYDDHERLAAAAAHVLVHRGVNNVFVLTKGLVHFADVHPSYVEGDKSALPAALDSPTKTNKSCVALLPTTHLDVFSSRSTMSSRASATTAQTLARASRSSSTASNASSARALSSSRAGSSAGGSSSLRRAPNRERLGARRDDDQLSRMSEEMSIADSVISRCATRKTRY